MLSADLLYQIALTKIANIGPILSKTLIGYCGGVDAVFNERFRSLIKIPGIGEAIAKNLVKANPSQLASSEIEFILKNKIEPLFYLDDNYPTRLKNYEDSPILLYYKGNTSLNANRTIGIVGTRKPTDGGKSICKKLVEDLKGYEVIILSGLAYGIDITAHRTCVEMDIPTIGVLGHGLDRIYPFHHKTMARKMLHNGGLLTEFCSGTLPDREHFPMRNRIIAGLCDAIVVVESKNSGGSIITADFGNSYNKDVFAFPGRINDEYSMGCNRLIKSHKANLIESADDIAYILRWDAIDAKKEIQTQMFIDLNHQEKRLFNLLHHNGKMGVDVINSYLNLSTSELASLLLELEFKGVIRSMPGKRYMVT
jgi:DNA processing protein